VEKATVVTTEDTLSLGAPTGQAGASAACTINAVVGAFVISRVDDTEVEAMGSFVGKKQEPRRR
jgi:hypothetical protein